MLWSFQWLALSRKSRGRAGGRGRLVASLLVSTLKRAVRDERSSGCERLISPRPMSKKQKTNKRRGSLCEAGAVWETMCRAVLGASRPPPRDLAERPGACFRARSLRLPPGSPTQGCETRPPPLDDASVDSPLGDPFRQRYDTGSGARPFFAGPLWTIGTIVFG